MKILSNNFEERIRHWQESVSKVIRMPYHGLLPSPPDPRDYSIDDIRLMAPSLPNKRTLPSSPLILDQGRTPYCGGASAAGIANSYYHQYDLMPDGGFSMAFIYWLAKEYDGIPHVSGTYLRTVLKIMHKYGCAPESLAPFSLNRISITPQALRVAENYKIEAYARLRSLSDIKLALLKDTYILIGTIVTRDNWRRPDGFLSYPAGDVYGGHATFCFGYDDTLKRDHTGYKKCQNSWGENWGDGGKFYLPYDYINMTYEGKLVFLEAWAVKFVPVQHTIPDKIEPSPEKRTRRTYSWVRRKYRGKR